MRKHLVTALATATAAALTGGLLVAAAGTAVAAGSGVPGDFNNDGYRDIAVAAPGAYVNGRSGAGQVVIVYGGVSDPSNARRAVISQDSAGVPGAAEAGDGFGGAIVAEDFNGDGYADLAVGAPGEDVGTDTDGGTVAMLWGSDTGLTSGVTVADPAPSSHDKFGRLLTALVDSDQKPDLAIASDNPTIDVYRGGFTKSGTNGGGYRFVPPASVTTAPASLTAGNFGGHDVIADLVVTGVSTYYVLGSASGLNPASHTKLPTSSAAAIGDFDNNKFQDIALGSPEESGGIVRVFNSDANGPAATASYSITQDSPGIPDTSEAGDRFGASLAVTRWYGGYQDLVVGAPGESLGSATGTGAVTYVYGTENGLDGMGFNDGTRARFYAQSTPNIAGNDETGDRFGSSVHLTDTHNDGVTDLAVGVSGENSADGAVVYLRATGYSGTPGITPAGTGVSTTGSPVFGTHLAG